MGRTALEFEVGIAASAGNFLSTSSVGDVTLIHGSNSANILLGVGSTEVARVSSSGFTVTNLKTTTGTGAGGSIHVNMQTNNTLRWGIGFGGVESSGNAGSNFQIWRYADNGSFINSAIEISRATGSMQVNGAATITGGLSLNNGQNITNVGTIFTTEVNFPASNATITGGGDITFTNNGGINFYHRNLTQIKSINIDSSTWGSDAVNITPLLIRNNTIGSPVSISLGRTTNELEFGVAASAGQYLAGTTSGDTVIRAPAGGRLFFGSGTGNPAVTLTGDGSTTYGRDSQKANPTAGTYSYSVLPGTRSSFMSTYAQSGTGTLTQTVFGLTSTGTANGCSITGTVSITNNPGIATSVVTNNTLTFTLSYAQGNVNISQTVVSSGTPSPSVTVNPTLAWDSTNNRLQLSLAPSVPTAGAMRYVWDAHFSILVNQNFAAILGSGTTTAFTVTTYTLGL